MKRLFQISVSALALIIAVWLIQSWQTQFGRIKQSKMVEAHNPTKIEQVVSKAREVLRLSTMDTRQRNYLKLGESQIEWSLKSTSEKTGWLYFFKPESNDEMWEFAPCSRRNLQDINASDLTAEFYRYGDARIKSVFGTDPRLEAIGAVNGRAILVRDGQVVLARLVHPPNLVYAIKFVDQAGTKDWGSIRIEYAEFDAKLAEPAGTASGRQPIRPQTNSTPSATDSAAEL